MRLQAAPALTERVPVMTEDNCSDEGLPEPCSSEVEYIINVYIFTTICILGILTNTVNILVLFSEDCKLKGPTFQLLRALAIADFFTLCLCVPKGLSRCVDARYSWEYHIRQVYEVFIFLPLANTFASASVWTTVSLSIERCTTVMKPVSAKSNWSKQRTLLCIILVYTCSLVINIPNFWYQQIDFEQMFPSVTEFGISQGFYVYLWIRMALLKGLPIILILAFNALLVKAVREANTRRKSLVFPLSTDNRRQHLQVRITAMMIAISVVFLLCHAMEPFVHYPVFAAIHGTCQLETTSYGIQRSIANTLEVLSFSTNFFFYCIFHKQFVCTLKQIVPWCRVRPVAPETVGSQRDETAGQGSMRLNIPLRERITSCAAAKHSDPDFSSVTPYTERPWASVQLKKYNGFGGT